MYTKNDLWSQAILIRVVGKVEEIVRGAGQGKKNEIAIGRKWENKNKKDEGIVGNERKVKDCKIGRGLKT